MGWGSLVVVLHGLKRGRAKQIEGVVSELIEDYDAVVVVIGTEKESSIKVVVNG